VGRSRNSLTGRALILALVAVTLFLTLAGPVRTWFAQRAEIAELRADVEATRERVAALQIEQERWDDPAFIAAEARRRLHFVLPGEVGYVTLGMETAEEELAAAAAAADQEWYSTLWSAVREADTGSSENSKDAEGDAAKKDAAKKDAAAKTDGAAKKDATNEDTAE